MPVLVTWQDVNLDDLSSRHTLHRPRLCETMFFFCALDCSGALGRTSARKRDDQIVPNGNVSSLVPARAHERSARTNCDLMVFIAGNSNLVEEPL